MPFLLYAQHKKLVVGKKSGLVELSRASRFSRSLARLASGKFQLVSTYVSAWNKPELLNSTLKCNFCDQLKFDMTLRYYYYYFLIV